VAIVTGGASGIGLGVAEALAGEGYVVYAADLAEPAGRPVRGAPGAVLDVHGDVRDSAFLAGLVERVVAERSRIDLLCTAAAVKRAGGALDIDEVDWDETYDVNVKGTFLAVRAVLPVMQRRRGGCIVTFGSPSGYAEPGALAYASSKGAILAFSRSLALDCIPFHIRVNTVVPGFTRTGMSTHVSAEDLARRARMNVAGRVNGPEDIAGAVLFLASDRAETISGAVLEVGRVQGEMAVMRA
jgi:3-oxoacyl-[acyl-carrier protein] reductase